MCAYVRGAVEWDDLGDEASPLPARINFRAECWSVPEFAAVLSSTEKSCALSLGMFSEYSQPCRVFEWPKFAAVLAWFERENIMCFVSRNVLKMFSTLSGVLFFAFAPSCGIIPCGIISGRESVLSENAATITAVGSRPHYVCLFSVPA